MRQCNTCGEKKPIKKFGTTISQGNGKKYHRRECYSCSNKRHSKWRQENRDHIRKKGAENMRAWRARMSKEDKIAYDKRSAEKARARRSELKDMIYKAYGGYKCVCCGVSEKMFLSIDHINNDGYTHRKNIKCGSGETIYRWLYRQFLDNGFWPDGFQILCMNCQHGKARNNGICPHQQ